MFSEKNKLRLIHSYEPAKAILVWCGVACGVAFTVLVIVAIIYLIPVLKGVAHNAEASARQSEDVTGHLSSASARIDNVAAIVEKKVEPIMNNFESASVSTKQAADTAAVRLPGILDNISLTAGRGGALLAQGEGLLADARQTTLPALNKPLGTLDDILVGTKPHVIEATEHLATAMKAMDDAMHDPEVKAFVEDAMKHSQSIIGNLDTVSGNLVLATDAGQQVAVNLARMTKDAADKFHEVLWPPAVKGFWPNVKRTFSFLVMPVLEGGRIYLTLKTLPVKITQPVPILK